MADVGLIKNVDTFCEKTILKKNSLKLAEIFKAVADLKTFGLLLTTKGFK